MLSLISLAFSQDASVDVERYKPSADQYGYFSTEGAETLGNLQLGVGFWINYANDPIVLVGPDGERVSLVAGDDYVGPLESRFTADAQLGFGFTDFLSLTADLPLVLRQTGYDLEHIGSLDTPGAIQPSGLGDLRLTPKLAPVSRSEFPVGVALSVPISVPTGAGTAFLGEKGVTATPTVIVEFSDAETWYRSYKWRGAVNLGYVVRPEDRVRDVTTGGAFVYRAAFGYRVAPPVELIGDLYGQTWGASPAQSPLELSLGSKFLIGQWMTGNAGFAVGLIPGLGTPDYRVFAGFTVAPSFDPNARDTDNDGVPDGEDRCPKHEEDQDGYQDNDGCPEDDNDGDGVDDQADKCPDDAEDDDGYMDNDGCPEPDNDKDGVADLQDRCPDQPENINGVDDEDGCPDAGDTDGDGYVDEVDRCPYDAEDKDDFQDLDGCPEDDNDNDGLKDPDDKCPNDREVFNGVGDEDGCPDEGGRVVLKADRIEINETIYFDTGKTTIKSESYDLLNEIAEVIKAHPELVKIRIEGHTDNVGDDLFNLKLSQGRAESVRNYLIQQGVEPERLQAVGFGEQVPLADNGTEAGRAQNRRVEFIIVKQNN